MICNEFAERSLTHFKIQGFNCLLYPGPSLPLWLKSKIYSGQGVDTIFPGGPSGQQTMPSQSGEQKPSAEKRKELT